MRSCQPFRGAFHAFGIRSGSWFVESRALRVEISLAGCWSLLRPCFVHLCQMPVTGFSKDNTQANAGYSRVLLTPGITEVTHRS